MLISIARTLSIAGQALAKRQLLSSYLMLRVKLGSSLCTVPSNRVEMSSLDRKLFRDLAKTKGQSLAACLVMACGLAMLIMTRSLVLSLESARADYYDECRFAEVLKRAPNSVRERFSAIPGVFSDAGNRDGEG